MIKLIGVSNLCVFVAIYFFGGGRGKSVADLFIADFSGAKREKWLSPFSRCSHLFSSLILTLL